MQKALCRVSDLPEGKSIAIEHGNLNLFAVRKQERIFLYLNRCPHQYVPLNWEPDNFLDSSGKLIQCSTHGALFNIESGECLQGPCLGQKLRPIDYEISDGKLYLKEVNLVEE